MRKRKKRLRIFGWLRGRHYYDEGFSDGECSGYDKGYANGYDRGKLSVYDLRLRVTTLEARIERLDKLTTELRIREAGPK